MKNLYAVSINTGDVELQVAATDLLAALKAALKHVKDEQLTALSIEVVDEVLVAK